MPPVSRPFTPVPSRGTRVLRHARSRRAARTRRPGEVRRCTDPAPGLLPLGTEAPPPFPVPHHHHLRKQCPPRARRQLVGTRNGRARSPRARTGPAAPREDRARRAFPYASPSTPARAPGAPSLLARTHPSSSGSPPVRTRPGTSPQVAEIMDLSSSGNRRTCPVGDGLDEHSRNRWSRLVPRYCVSVAGFIDVNSTTS